MTTRPIEWIGDEGGLLRLLDQTRLPSEVVSIDCRNADQVFEAIRSLRVRGAPAIGVSAAYGLVLGLQSVGKQDRAAFDRQLEETSTKLAGSRPTAVNLFWAIERMGRVARESAECPSPERLRRMFLAAGEIDREDQAMCAEIGRNGAPLLAGLTSVLTHCNAGALATAGEGTALSVIFEAVRQGQSLHVFADETRPLCQGARLTAWELTERGIPCTVLCDSMAGLVMKQQKVQAVIVGADRIAANGDAANKIGTYSLAVLAKAHGIPFYVAAPFSTFDLAIETGEAIPIEERGREEIAEPWGRVIVPQECAVYNPAFDVTPARLITAIVTERGVISPVNAATVKAMLDRPPRKSPQTPVGAGLR